MLQKVPTVSDCECKDTSVKMLQKVLTASDCECKDENVKKIIVHDHAVQSIPAITWKQSSSFGHPLRT